MKKEIVAALLRHYGSQKALARALGVTQGSISQSIKAGWFPAGQAVRIERATIFIRALDLVKPD